MNYADCKYVKLYFFIIMLFGFLLEGCKVNENHEIAVEMAADLQVANDYWLKQGKPKNFDPAITLKSSTESIFIYTNEVNVNSNSYHCCFAVRSQRVTSTGIMAISDEGVLLWIPDKNGGIIVSPERNGITP